jgi:hypothetical protein
MCISDLQSNIYITKMYGTMNIKLKSKISYIVYVTLPIELHYNTAYLVNVCGTVFEPKCVFFMPQK